MEKDELSFEDSRRFGVGQWKDELFFESSLHGLPRKVKDRLSLKENFVLPRSTERCRLKVDYDFLYEFRSEWQSAGLRQTAGAGSQEFGRSGED